MCSGAHWRIGSGDDSCPRHSPDFASFRWRDKLFTFTPLQRRIVQHLYEAWQNGTPFVSQAMLLEVSDASGNRIRDIFRNCAAWGVLVQPGLDCGGPTGTFCLVDPDQLAIK